MSYGIFNPIAGLWFSRYIQSSNTVVWADSPKLMTEDHAHTRLSALAIAGHAAYDWDVRPVQS